MMRVNSDLVIRSENSDLAPFSMSAADMFEWIAGRGPPVHPEIFGPHAIAYKTKAGRPDMARQILLLRFAR